MGYSISPMTGVLTGREEHSQAHRHREDTHREGHVKLCCHRLRNTEEIWEPPEAKKSQGRTLFQSPQGLHGPVNTLISDLLPLEL